MNARGVGALLRRAVALAFALGIAALGSSATAADGWQETTWHGERGLASNSGTWRAVVSVDRGRLVYFGHANGERNLLFAPETRDGPAGWGGHRVWLGPQASWDGGWPPPAAWEASAAERVAVNGARLELAMPPAGGKWPRFSRIYFWRHETLHCVVTVEPATTPVQVIQIVQVPSDAVVALKTSASVAAPRGYVLLHLGRGDSPVEQFEPIAQVREGRGDAISIRHNGAAEKIGVFPQTITAALRGEIIEASRGEACGMSASIPDKGYVTQIYVGTNNAPFIELEQLSPLLNPGERGSFEMVLSARAKDESR